MSKYKVTEETRKNKAYFKQIRELTQRLINGERTIALCNMCGNSESAKEIAARCRQEQAKMTRLVKQAQRTINTVPDPMYRMTLQAYFIQGYSLRKIARGIGVGKSTVGNYVNAGVSSVRMPRKPIHI